MNFVQMMAELQAEYLASMPQKLSDISAHLAAGDVATLREDFHKLKGTGKTYGIAEISELCEVVEKICLNKKGEAPAAVKVAMILLSEIHKARLQKKAFSVSDRPDFLAMKKLL